MEAFSYSNEEERKKEMYAYVGSFNYMGAEGITVCRYDPDTGVITPDHRFCEDINAGSLTWHRGKLYSTDEQSMSRREGGGGLCTFSVLPETGEPTEVKHIYTLAANTSGVTFDKTGAYMLVTHFAIGPAAVKVVPDGHGGWKSKPEFHDNVTCLYKLNSDGTPGKLCDILYHPMSPEGKPSFIHKAFLTPDGEMFGYGNLGTDRIGFLKIDYAEEKLTALYETECKDFSGPRHLVMHPALPYLYLNYERHPFISKFRYTPDACIWEADESMLPSGTEMDLHHFNQSEILIDASGKHLYNVMRGLGMIYVLDIDPENGNLTMKQMLPTESKAVRCAALSPDGRFFLTSCNDLEAIVSYRIQEDGTLTQAAVSEHITHPSAIVFCQ